MWVLSNGVRNRARVEGCGRLRLRRSAVGGGGPCCRGNVGRWRNEGGVCARYPCMVFFGFCGILGSKGSAMHFASQVSEQCTGPDGT